MIRIRKRKEEYVGPGIGSECRGVLNWNANTYSIKYRNPWKFDAYKQQGIGRITALRSIFCDEETFISPLNQIYETVDLKTGDGYISMDFFEMDADGFLIVNKHESEFLLNAEKGQLENLECN